MRRARDTKAAYYGTLSVSALLCSLAMSAPARAADKSDQVTSAPAGAADNTDQPSSSDIVVTARKSEERLSQVPIPVTAVDTGVLAANNQVLLRDFVTSVPGLILNPQVHAVANLTIRGVPGVGILIDSVPYTVDAGGGFSQPGPPDLDPSDLSRIEVLRGPQGTLYGASGKAGLINYITKDPSTTAFNGTVQAGTEYIHNGSEPGYDLRGSLNIPISQTLAIRGSAFTRQDAGYIDNPILGRKGVNEGHAVGGRFSVLWKPTTDTSLKLSALYQQLKSDGQTQERRAPGLGELEQDLIAGAGVSNRTDQAYSAEFKTKLGAVSVVSLTGYSRSKYTNTDDFSFAIGPNTQLYQNYLTKQFSQELRLSGTLGSNLDWIVGGFYQNVDRPNSQSYGTSDPVTGAPITSLGFFPEGVKFREFAEFGTLTYHFSDRFDVQLGARESEQKQHDTTSGVIGKKNTFTYLVSPRFKITPDVMVYARAASGFSPGGFNGPLVVSQGAPAGSGPERTNNYELGLKGSFFDHRLSVDASVFYTRYSNIILTLVNANKLTYFANGGKAKSEGFDLTVEAKPIRNLTIGGFVNYTNAVLTQDLSPAASVAGSSGDRLPLSSRWSGKIYANLDIPLNDSITGFAGADVTFVGDRIDTFVTSGTARTVLPSYSQTDLRVGARYETWSLTVYGRNMFDKRGILASTPSYFGADGTVVYIQPRTIGVSLSKSF